MLAVTLLFLGSCFAFSDDITSGSAPPAADEALKAQLLAICQSDAAEYKIELLEPTPRKLTLVPEPVFVWTNPTRQGGQYGAVYVWSFEGRPEVIGSIFASPRSDGKHSIHHELHSLATGRLAARRGDDKPAWEPSVAGVELRAISGAAVPGSTPAARLLQMRTLAREFSAESEDTRGHWDLRLLPRPLYRYGQPSSVALDGALFTFVTSAGTDPEVLLILEARNGADGTQWYYGVARFSDLSLTVRRHGQKVWGFTRTVDATELQTVVTDRYRLFRDRLVDVASQKRQ